MSNSTVPIYLDNATGLEPPVDDGWTLAETSLGAFVEPLNLGLLEGSDSPLITVKLSFNTERNETVIGLVVARQLGKFVSGNDVPATDRHRSILQRMLIRCLSLRERCRIITKAFGSTPSPRFTSPAPQILLETQFLRQPASCLNAYRTSSSSQASLRWMQRFPPPWRTINKATLLVCG